MMTELVVVVVILVAIKSNHHIQGDRKERTFLFFSILIRLKACIGLRL